MAWKGILAGICDIIKIAITLLAAELPLKKERKLNATTHILLIRCSLLLRYKKFSQLKGCEQKNWVSGVSGFHLMSFLL